jgi:hypothetical protein
MSTTAAGIRPRCGGQLLLAAGSDAEHLRKRGTAIPYSDRVMNPKEASIVPVAHGTCRLFFEYAQSGASEVGIASAPAVDGPWTVQPPIFESRPGCWDGWHLSPGPLLCTDPARPGEFQTGDESTGNTPVAGLPRMGVGANRRARPLQHQLPI